MKWLALIVIFILVLLFYVRLAPSDAARWHRSQDRAEATNSLNSAMREIAAGSDTLQRLDAIIRQTSRTHVLAGTPGNGMITYVTRSALFGFPDYTTIHQRDDTIEIYGRARFGSSDFGVNAARIDGWLEALAQGG